MNKFTVILLSSMWLSGCGTTPDSTPIDEQGQSEKPPYGMYCMCRDKPEYKELLMCKQLNEKAEALGTWQMRKYEAYCDGLLEGKINAN